MVKIVVKVENGLVQDVYSNSENVEVLVLDKDNKRTKKFFPSVRTKT
jgi:hypothetical protein